MRAFLIAVSVIVMAASAPAQQQTGAANQKDDQSKAKTAPKVLTLTGCIERGTERDQFTLADEQNGKYQVTGNRIGRYVGQRVEIAGTAESPKLVVKGGLWPSPNVAGQAGDIDPTKAAMAAQPGGPASGTGDVTLPTFKVKSVKTVAGGCK
jgi:hypothetical protein